MKTDVSLLVAILSLPVMLGAAGLGTFFWMAGSGWSDVTGVGVGVIYVALTVIQVIFTVSWWRIMKKQPEQDQVQFSVSTSVVSNVGAWPWSNQVVLALYAVGSGTYQATWVQCTRSYGKKLHLYFTCKQLLPLVQPFQG